MDRATRVAVFESENPAEIQLVKSKLEEQKIMTFLNDQYVNFTMIANANTVHLMVNLQEEKQALEIIDKMLRELEFNPNIN